jgi:ribosome-binding protein aMBF1 (putative translation factor)
MVFNDRRVKKSLYSQGQKQIAQAIRQMREAAELSQRDLASKLGRPLNVVSRIETAQRRVDLLEWIALCKACRVDPIEEGTRILKTLDS